ncbi:MAG: GNAT family N-acetyltransferase [Solirubrobacterales bacterium]|nr:GNAT family N-acetyltransferase [Solirubrobacterales bacterium]
MISIPDISAFDEKAWRELAARAIEPNPFYEVDFLVPACRHLRNGKNVMLLVATKAGRFHACLPVRTASASGKLFWPVISSWVQNLYGSLGTPLVSPERAVEALRCLLATLRGDGRCRRVVVLESVGDDGPIASYLRRAADDLGVTIGTYAPGERVVVRCQEDNFDALPTRVKRERKARVRTWRRLCADWGHPAVLDRARDRDSATRFLALEASGWKGRSGTAMASRTEDAAFYREVTARFVASHRLRMYSLEVGANRLAMQTSFWANRALFVWKSAYDERFARYAPGAQLKLQVFDLAREDGVQWIDSCADAINDHWPRLSHGRRRITTLAIGGRGPMHRPLLKLAVLLVDASGKLHRISRTNFRYKINCATRWPRRRSFLSQPETLQSHGALHDLG